MKNQPPQTFPVMAGATDPVPVDGGNVPVANRALASRAEKFYLVINVLLVASVPTLLGAVMCLAPLLTNGQSMISGNLVLGCILGPLGLGLLLTAAVARILR